MEKEGLRWCLDKLMVQDVNISIIGIDIHTGIVSLMKTDYPHINHQFDVWHLAKSVTKSLVKKAKAKHCFQLFPWIQSISNHLWWSVQTCNGDKEMLVEKSIVHHISNVHKWDNDPNALFLLFYYILLMLYSTSAEGL